MTTTETWISSTHFIAVKLEKNFNDASEFCQSQFGTELASIHSTVNNIEAHQLCLDASNYPTESFHICWIGLNYNGSNWGWIDDTKFDFTLWDTNYYDPQPQNRNGEDCGFYWMSADDAWHDHFCQTTTYFICNKLNQTTYYTKSIMNMPSIIIAIVVASLIIILSVIGACLYFKVISCKCHKKPSERRTHDGNINYHDIQPHDSNDGTQLEIVPIISTNSTIIDDIIKLRYDDSVFDVKFIIHEPLRAHVDERKDEMDLTVDIDVDENGQTSKTFNGISALFAAQSTILKRQLFGGFQEALPNHDNIKIVETNDITIESFEFIYDYVYGVDFQQITNNIIIDVLYASQKYDMNQITAKCMKQLTDINDINNWYLIMFGFGKYNKLILADFYLHFIRNNELVLNSSLMKIVRSHKFKQPNNAMKCWQIEMLIKENISSPRNYQQIIYQSCVSYLDNNTNRNEMKVILREEWNKYFNFQQFDISYLNNELVKKYGILSAAEVLDYMTNKTQNRPVTTRIHQMHW